MIAGLVLMSAVVGLVAMGGALALSVPTWMVFALYPVACSLTLLVTAAVLNFKAVQPSQPTSLLRQQA